MTLTTHVLEVTKLYSSLVVTMTTMSTRLTVTLHFNIWTTQHDTAIVKSLACRNIVLYSM